MNTQSTLTPFLKWPGGKRWFVQNYRHLLPNQFNRYIEPFLGGGAVFFYLQPDQAILSDVNPELMATYGEIKGNWKAVEKSLRYHHREHCAEHYYRTRGKELSGDLPKASRTIYLNRTCFNGIYRVNREGRFNVPMGTKTNVVLETDDFEKISQLLQNASLHTCDFAETILRAKEDDLVFADPPYTVRHNLNGFVKYNETLFSWNDQVRLADALIQAKNRGVKVVLTNANHYSIRELYGDRGFHLETVSRYSSIAASPEKRKQFEELVILTHPNP